MSQYHEVMGKSDWTKIKKRHASLWESIWFYAWKVNHGSGLSITACDGAVLDGPTIHVVSFYWHWWRHMIECLERFCGNP